MVPEFQNNISQGSNTGKFARHVIVDNTPSKPVPVDLIEGTEVSAANPPPNDFLITTMKVTDVVTEVPPAPQANRIGVEIFNIGTNFGGTGKQVFWNRSSTITTTFPVTTSTSYGKVLAGNESSNFQLSNKSVFAVCKPGEEAWIQITEWTRTPPP